MCWWRQPSCSHYCSWEFLTESGLGLCFHRRKANWETSTLSVPFFFFSFLFLDITKILFHSFAPVLGRFLTYQILSPLPSFPLLPSRSLQGGWGAQTDWIVLQTCFPIKHHNRGLGHMVQKRKHLVELNWLFSHRDIRNHGRLWGYQCQSFPIVKYFTHEVSSNRSQRKMNATTNTLSSKYYIGYITKKLFIWHYLEHSRVTLKKNTVI